MKAIPLKISHTILLTLTTILAFWIKFNIVFFTIKPYTATKIFYPFFFLVLIYSTVRQFNWKLLKEKRNILLALVAITFLFPIGYYTNPHDLAVYKRMALSLVSFLSLYYSVSLLDLKARRLLLFAVLLFCILALVYFYMQYLFSWTHEIGHFRKAKWSSRPPGILDDPDHSSGVYLVGFFLILALGKLYKRLFIALLISPLFAYAIFKSQAAGASLGLAFGIFALLFYLVVFKVKKPSLKQTFLVFWTTWLSLFLLLVMFIVFYRFNIIGFADLLHFFKGKETILQRIDLITVAKNIFQENPIFGVGLANDFYPTLVWFYSSPDMVTSTQSHIHTSYLSAIATTGLIGFTALFSLVTLSIYRFASVFQSMQKQGNGSIVVICFSGFLAIQMLSFSLQYLYSVSFWFTLALPWLVSGFVRNEQ